jgi:hypothetical protein
MNKEPKYTYECNDEIYNNELEKSDSNKRNESEDDEEEHLQILNNAKNVLNQIQDDINKFSEAYGIQNILPKNESISRNNNPISEHHSNYHNYIFNNNNNDSDNENSNSNNNNNIYIDNNGNNDNNNNDYNNDYDNNNDDYNNDYNNENIIHNNNDYNHYVNENEENNNYNEDEENNYENEEEYYHDNNDENNLNEINAHNYDYNDDNDNEEENYVNNLNNKNSSIKFKFNDNKEKINTLYQHDNNFYDTNIIQEEKENIEDDNYQHYLDEDDEEQQEKNNYLNDFTDNINMTNIINNNNRAIPAHNSSQNKYNFENPLNYDKENMKNNFKKYSNYSTYINQKNKSFDEINNENTPMQDNRRKKTKSSSKPRMRLQNNMDNNEYMNKISKTNNPKYKKNKNRVLNVSNDNIFSIKNKEKFENMKKDLENKFAKEHPFKPKINKKYNSEIKKNDETEEERLNRLSRPKILDINEKKRKKDLEELKKIYENNKVKPTYKVDPKEVSNRLYNNHQKMKIKKDRIKQNYEETQNKEYSFAPEINNYSKILMDKYQKKPIYERNEEFEKQKIDNIIRMRQEIEKEQKERCKPLINDKSRKLAEQNRNNRNDEEYEDVYERLYKENINKDTKSLGNRDMKECTFAPKLNPMSNYLLNDNDDYENGNEDCNENLKDFLERQKMYENLKKEKLEKKIINNKNNYTFKPEINSNSDLLVKCNPERYGEKLNDKYSRL